MATDLSAITAFTEARLAEWEAAAKTAQLVRAEGWYEIAQQAVACTDTIEIGFAYQHIVLHDPASMLDEIAAIRLILAEHAHVRAIRTVEGIDFGCRICAYDSAYDEVSPLGWCRTVRALAAIWKRHPEYQAGWAP